MTHGYLDNQTDIAVGAVVFAVLLAIALFVRDLAKGKR
jgi:hypothetical protein